MAIKRMQMYRKNLDTSETNLYPLTEAQYVSMENGQTVQEILSDRDSDKYTPVITNSSSTFKVGQGDNVDLSSSMKEGAYDSCVLKGKTMVNCIQEPSSKDVVLPYAFEDGQYVTINDTKESGALGVELKGQTLVNLVPSSVVVSGGRKLHKDDGSGQIVYTYKPKVPLKPNTVYTCFVWLKDVVNPNSVPLNCSMSNRDFYARPMTNGLNIAVGTTKSELGGENCNIRIGNADVIAGARGVLLDAVVVEGDYSSIEINPFYGMTSCKMPILHTVGNNLFDLSYYGNLDNLKNTTDAYVSYKKLLKLEPNTRYRILSDSCVLPARMWSVFGVDDKNSKRLVTVYNHNRWEVETENDYGAKDSVFTTPADGLVNFTCYARHRNPDTLLQSFSNEAMFTTIMGNLRLVKDGFSTVHEPYKSSILSLPEEVVLRSLPNGVRDTFNTRTGVYTRYIEEVVLNGADPITSLMRSVSDVNTTTSRCYLDYGNIPDNIAMKRYSSANTASDKIICDLLPTLSVVPDVQTTDIESIGQTTAGFSIRVRGKSIAECKQRLAERPVTILYERQVPIVTKINLSSTLKSWNTTTHIHSEIPENTLYPILSHSNPTYPVILKPSTKYSIIANSYSNSHTNSPINFNLGGATATTTVGNRVTTITTPSTLSNELLTMSGRGNKLNNVMVIEGDVVGDEPYFEGICDCKSPILSNVGKNISPINTYETTVWAYAQGYQGFNRVLAKNIMVDENKEYHLSFTKECEDGLPTNLGDIMVQFSSIPASSNVGDHNSVYTHCQNNKGKKYAHITMPNIGAGSNYIGKKVTLTNIQLRESSTLATYEPHKSNTTTFDQKDGKTIVLRSLPDGTCDTLNVETGEYVQRIGEVNTKSLQTTVNLSIGAEANVVFVNGINGKFIGWDECNVASDKLQWTYRADINWSKSSSINGIAVEPNGGFWFIVDKTIETKEQANEFLVNLDATIQYELTTPIVSTIDVQGFPYAYTNGHVQLSSGSIEQSLTPKVEYSLSANKTGQINSNTKRVSAHQKQLDDFEAMMLTSMVQSAYDKAILQFDYEMQMMSLGGE